MDHVAILEALKELGDDPETVALTLYKRGIRGVRKDCWGCPVTRYLRSRGFSSAIVSRCNITEQENLRAALPTPDVVSEFIRRFDNTEYPYLIKIEYY